MSCFCESRRMGMLTASWDYIVPFGAIRYRTWRPTFVFLHVLTGIQCISILYKFNHFSSQIRLLAGYPTKTFGYDGAKISIGSTDSIYPNVNS